MTSGVPRPFISVKFTPTGRTQTFLLPDLALDEPAPSPDANRAQLPPSSQQGRASLLPGDSVVVHTEAFLSIADCVFGS